MSIENKFGTYLAALDGNHKDFSSIEHLFEDLFHLEFVLEENDSPINRDQMKEFQAKACNMGSKFTLLHFSTTSPSTVEFKFHSSNDQWDITVHNIGTVKDGKLYRAKPVKESGSKPLLLVNFEAYIAAFDGTPKDYSQVSHIVDAVYHDEFEYQADGKPVDKGVIKQYQAKFFALGSKATLLHFKEVGSETVEFEFRLVNENFDTVFHNVAQVKDNKIIAFALKDQAYVKKVREVVADIEINKGMSVEAEESKTTVAPQ